MSKNKRNRHSSKRVVGPKKSFSKSDESWKSKTNRGFEEFSKNLENMRKREGKQKEELLLRIEESLRYMNKY